MHPGLTQFGRDFYILSQPIYLSERKADRRAKLTGKPFKSTCKVRLDDASRSANYSAVILSAAERVRRTAITYAAQATLSAPKVGKAITLLEFLDSAFKFKFPFLQSRAFGMLTTSPLRNRN